MKNSMGIILTGENDVDLKELSQFRSVAAVPIAGRYRIIDFILSNMVNSGLRNIGLITQKNYHSLMDHLDSGKEWDLNRKKDGLFILPPYVSSQNTGWYKGDVDALHNVISYIRRSTQKYVILSSSHIICNLTFENAFQFHMDRNADITVLYTEEKEDRQQELSRYTMLEIRADGRVQDIEVNPSMPKTNKAFMEIYIMEKSLLEYLVEECIAHGNYDFVRDILLKKLDLLKIFGYAYNGYVARIDSIRSYYRHNMDILDPVLRYELFFRSGLIYTKVKDEVPAKYGENVNISNCMVADGCIIDGDVKDSILFRGVRIGKGAQIKNCIIMQDSEVQDNAILEHVILDKGVMIHRGRRLTGQDTYPVVIGKGTVI